MIRTTKLFLRLSLTLLFLLLSLTIRADNIFVFGQHGEMGFDGVDGLPGGAGENGGEAKAELLTTDDLVDPSDIELAAIGGDGGSGGQGSDGTEDQPNGASGGDGGSGGNATSESNLDVSGLNSNVTVIARGGTGGNGGMGGSGYLTAPDGRYGNGGSGGDAIAHSLLVFLSDNDTGQSTATAYGGTSGSGLSGNGLQGATGGSAEAISSASNTFETGFVSATSTAVGGNGGGINGSFALGNGGQGGAATANSNTAGLSASSASATVSGGSGGTGRGIGFRGGDGAQGVVSSTATVNSGNHDAESSTFSRGGDGGRGEEGADGGNGASVFLENSALGSSAGNVVLSQTAVGGNGGDAFDMGSAGFAGNAITDVDVFQQSQRIEVQDEAIGGDGGKNSYDGLASAGGYGQASGHLLSTGEALLRLTARGGVGGEASSGAAGGDGGDAIIGDAIIRASGDASIVIVAEAGSNGLGQGLGQDGHTAVTGEIDFSGTVFGESVDGGTVDVSIMANGANAVDGGTTHDVVLVDEARGQTTGSLILEQVANAGDTDFYNAERSNHAADAVASLQRVANVDSLQISNIAAAGDGPDAVEGVAGTGGSAQAYSIGENLAGDVHSMAHATGGHGGHGRLGAHSGAGGEANATAEASGTVVASAVAVSIGGNAGSVLSGSNQLGVDGAATSIATASSNIEATATAFSSTNRDFINQGLARNTSSASAHAVFAAADAESTSTSTGVIRTIRAQGINGGQLNALARSTTASNTITAPDLQATSQGATATMIGLPDTEQIDAVLDSHQNVADDFDVAGESDILGFINLGVGFNSQGSVSPAVYEARVSASIDIEQLSVHQSLLLGLLDFDVSVAGEDSWSLQIQIENDLVFEQVFTSILEVENFFDDRTLDFGLIADLTTSVDNVLDLELILLTGSALANTGLAFTAIFGNSTLDVAAVPLPAGVWLFVSAFGMLVLCRRRQAA